MELFVIIIALLLLLVGLFGAILPILPGPIISYIGLLIFYFFTDLNLSSNELFIYSIVTILVFFSDYMLQFIGVKKFGGEKFSMYGTFLGILVGLFFPPIGLVLVPFLGALIGAFVDNKERGKAIGIAIGALVGFVFGTILKIIYSLYILYIVINKLFNF
ncbi:MAG: hypothetical protein CMP49_03775 [Flavobacteriales bacterium]|nr:hypothetical protein [Flavobacteriales bacterium]